MNNRGFTLVELLATLVILGLVVSIGSVTIITIMNNVKQKNYQLLKANITSAAETFYEECEYADDSNPSLYQFCTDSLVNNTYIVTLGNLMAMGYIKGNSKEGSAYGLINPVNNGDIGPCLINVTYDTASGRIIVTPNGVGDSCPDSYN